MIVALGVLLAACGDDRSPAGDGTPSADDTTSDVTLPAPDDAGDTVDGSWSLTSGTVDDVPLSLIDGWDVTLVVERGAVSGRAACNGYGGSVDVGDGTFRVSELSWTEMGCEPSVMELEQAFLRGLSAVTSFTIAGGVLTLSGPTTELVLGALAPVPDSEIIGTTWVLDTYIDGEAASNMPIMELATLTLNADGTLTGSTSCRQLTGMWITTGATIQFTSFSAIDDPTAGVCAPESQTLDGLVISVLESGFTVEVDGPRMTLMAPGNEGLSYTTR